MQGLLSDKMHGLSAPACAGWGEDADARSRGEAADAGHWTESARQRLECRARLRPRRDDLLAEPQVLAAGARCPHSLAFRSMLSQTHPCTRAFPLSLRSCPPGSCPGGTRPRKTMTSSFPSSRGILKATTSCRSSRPQKSLHSGVAATKLITRRLGL